MKKQLSLTALTLLILVLLAFQVSAQENLGKPEIVGGDEDSLREMLSQIVWLPYPGEGGATVYVGELPDNLPFELSFPEDATLIGTVVYSESSPYPRPAQVYFETSLVANDVIAYFEENLPAAFTRVDEAYMPSMTPGFQAGNIPQSTMFCYNEDEGLLAVNAVAYEAGTRVWLEIAGEDAAIYSPCNAPDPSGGMPEAYRILPTLSSPQGVEIRQGLGGGGGGMDSANSTVTLISESLQASDLVSYYTDEIATAGWTITSSASQVEGGWLTATLTQDDDTWILNLTLLQDPLQTTQYSASVTVYMAR